MQEDDEAFEAFVRGIRPRSVLEAEQERTVKGYAPDEAMLKHGVAIEEKMQRTLERKAEILSFPAVKKPDGA